MTSAQSELMDWVRTLIADEPLVREVSMFGGRSVMVAERMVVSVLEDGGLLVRVDPERHEEHLARSGSGGDGGGPQHGARADRDRGRRDRR